MTVSQLVRSLLSRPHCWLHTAYWKHERWLTSDAGSFAHPCLNAWASHLVAFPAACEAHAYSVLKPGLSGPDRCKPWD